MDFLKYEKYENHIWESCRGKNLCFFNLNIIYFLYNININVIKKKEFQNPAKNIHQTPSYILKIFETVLGLLTLCNLCEHFGSNSLIYGNHLMMKITDFLI